MDRDTGDDGLTSTDARCTLRESVAPLAAGGEHLTFNPYPFVSFIYPAAIYYFSVTTKPVRGPIPPFSFEVR